MMTSLFTCNRKEKLRPAILQFADELIDKILADPTPMDLVTALPLPSLMICARMCQFNGPVMALRIAANR
ncbi:hypothetical protein [Streptomyces sp. NPDC097610]|uniref:hypothetical protein n=1 Tax=Streptomyces sp. NPDC097610 TaxID=3157227 RepID=UPI0033313A5D